MRVLLLAIVLVSTSSFADPKPLGSTVSRVQLENALVVVPASSGKTVLDRYRSRAKPVARTPLVLIVRLPDANSPDVIAVTNAHRDRTKIMVTIESRRFVGPLAANDVTTPLIEVSLGELAAGTYTVSVAETVLHFTKYGAPQTATPANQPGMKSSMSLTLN